MFSPIIMLPFYQILPNSPTYVGKTTGYVGELESRRRVIKFKASNRRFDIGCGLYPKIKMSSNNTHNYIFVDESGDPGKPFKADSQGNKTPTGASLYYILSAVCVDSKQLFLLEDKIMEVKNKFGYKKEIKSTDVSLALYKALLNILNQLNIKTYYRLVDKKKYKGKFAADGRKNHNVFDEYNLVKLVNLATRKSKFLNTEIVIDRADRRLLDGNFENCDSYLKKRVNTKTIQRIKHVTHVDSEYVNVMQMSDLVSGAIKDHFTKRNTDLKKIINRSLLVKIF